MAEGQMWRTGREKEREWVKNEEQTKSMIAAEKRTHRSSQLSAIFISVTSFRAGFCFVYSGSKMCFSACFLLKFSNQGLVCDLVPSFSSHLLSELEENRLSWLHTDWTPLSWFVLVSLYIHRTNSEAAWLFLRLRRSLVFMILQKQKFSLAQSGLDYLDLWNMFWTDVRWE